MVEKLNVVKVDGEPIKISDDFIQTLMSKTSFIESLSAVDLFKGNDLRQEVSELRQEVAELKQKLEER